MRERRKKKKKFHETNSGSSKNDETTIPNHSNDNNDEASVSAGKKRPRSSEDENPAKVETPKQQQQQQDPLTTKRVGRTLYIMIPSDLSSKAAKKFRKDARRKIRQTKTIQDSEYDDVEFVTKEDMPSILQPKKKKRKQNQFPSIQELLKQKQHLESMQKEDSKLQEKLDKIPEATRNKYIALDCEMVGIGTDGKKSALARVSIVDWNLQVLLDTFVQVPMRVTDFRTHVSGVEPKHIKSQNNAMPVNECRQKVSEILKGKILVGHALTNDFKALMTSHPKEMIRDTSKYRPFQRYGNGKWRARKLRDLVKENLKHKEDFQEGEHDSVQDAMATMELFQVVYSQWEKELENKTR